MYNQHTVTAQCNVLQERRARKKLIIVWLLYDAQVCDIIHR